MNCIVNLDNVKILLLLRIQYLAVLCCLSVFCIECSALLQKRNRPSNVPDLFRMEVTNGYVLVLKDPSIHALVTDIGEIEKSPMVIIFMDLLVAGCRIVRVIELFIVIDLVGSEIKFGLQSFFLLSCLLKSENVDDLVVGFLKEFFIENGCVLHSIIAPLLMISFLFHRAS